MRVFILSILLFLTSCSSAPSGSNKSTDDTERFYINGKLYDVGYIYKNYVENAYNQYKIENYCTGGIFLVSYSSSKKKFVRGGSLANAKTERVCITSNKILALYDTRYTNDSKSNGKFKDLACWTDNKRLLSKNNPSKRGNIPYDACNSQFAVIDSSYTASISLMASIALVGLPVLFDPSNIIPGNYKNHFRFFSPPILAEAVRQSGILTNEAKLNNSKLIDLSLRQSQNPSINNEFRLRLNGEAYSDSVKRVKRKLIRLNYFDGIITYVHDSDLNTSLTAFLNDEGFCSFTSNPSGIKKTEILSGEYCKYYFTGALWIPFQSEAIIESEKLEDLLNSAILRIRE